MQCRKLTNALLYALESRTNFGTFVSAIGKSEAIRILLDNFTFGTLVASLIYQENTVQKIN